MEHGLSLFELLFLFVLVGLEAFILYLIARS